jgi:hypothetical protein
VDTVRLPNARFLVEHPGLLKRVREHTFQIKYILYCLAIPADYTQRYSMNE